VTALCGCRAENISTVTMGSRVEGHVIIQNKHKHTATYIFLSDFLSKCRGIARMVGGNHPNSQGRCVTNTPDPRSPMAEVSTHR
jgi:hypothetical protein